MITPTKPWEATKRDRLPGLLILISSLCISALLDLFTGLSGKLGFTSAFLVLYVSLNFAFYFKKNGLQAAKDSFMQSLIYSCAVVVFVPVVSILATVVIKGFPGLHKTLFTQTMFSASYMDPVSNGGLLHAIIGTIYLIVITALISVPIGIGTALYMTEIKGYGSNFIRFVVQAMSGVPSVVAGLFIYAALVLSTPIRPSAIVGAFALSILMIPTVTRTAEEVLLLVPQDLREASFAIGATQWRTVFNIVLPTARNGLITATILGIARIAGETAPLLFTIGGSDKLNLNPFNEYQGALPFYIWKGLLLGTPESIQRAWTGILVLLVLVLTLFVLARKFGRKA